MEKGWRFRLETTSVARGDALRVSTDDPDIVRFKHVGCSIARVDKDEDLFVFYTNVPVTVDANGGATFTFPTTELLEGRLYFVSQLVLMATDAADTGDPSTQRVAMEEPLFEITAAGQAPSSLDELKARHQAVLAARQADFLAGVGDKGVAGSLEFEALVFIKNCLVRTRMRVGPCELVPFEGLGCHAEIVHMNDFLKKACGAEGLANVEDVVRQAQMGQPCFVAYL
jgi:hypothetical protein